jgi:hypothetical protein
MKTLKIWNLDAETSRTVEVGDAFYAFIVERHNKRGYQGDPAEMSERQFDCIKKSFGMRQSGEYAKGAAKMKELFSKMRSWNK